MFFDEELTPVDIEYRRKRRTRRFVFFVFVLLVAALAYWRLRVPVPVDYVSNADHFKYGSIGSDTQYGGIPFRVWQVLPSIFPEYLPDQGAAYLAIPENQRSYLDAYGSFGFLVEEGHETPIGFSLRRDGIKLIGLNCAACHVSTVLVAKEELANLYGSSNEPSTIGRSDDSANQLERAIILGMPANTVDLGAYFAFLFRCADDRRFNADTIMAAIKDESETNGKIGLVEKIGVQSSITRLRNTLNLRRQQLKYLALLPHGENEQSMPRFGPGRVDTFTPYKSIQLAFPWDGSSGIADFPSIWNQLPRDGLQLHWDGNNKSVFERNISASLGAGASPTSLDMHRMLRVANWIGSPPKNQSLDDQKRNRLNPVPKPDEMQIPKYPFAVDRALAQRGKAIFRSKCYECHGWSDDYRLGKVVDIKNIGTDPARLDSYTEAFQANQNLLGVGQSWRFKHFTKTYGYANAPLDGVWARAPFLHNGSVPSLVDLLNKPCTSDDLKTLGITDAESFAELIADPEQVGKLIQLARAKKLRPPIFYRGDDRYDSANAGFRCGSERTVDGKQSYTDKSDDGRRLFLFSTVSFDKGEPVIDTKGNGHQGHRYGIGLKPKEKAELIEYLKLIDDPNL